MTVQSRDLYTGGLLWDSNQANYDISALSLDGTIMVTKNQNLARTCARQTSAAGASATLWCKDMIFTGLVDPFSGHVIVVDADTDGYSAFPVHLVASNGSEARRFSRLCPSASYTDVLAVLDNGSYLVQCRVLGTGGSTKTQYSYFTLATNGSAAAVSAGLDFGQLQPWAIIRNFNASAAPQLAWAGQPALLTDANNLQLNISLMDVASQSLTTSQLINVPVDLSGCSGSQNFPGPRLVPSGDGTTLLASVVIGCDNASPATVVALDSNDLSVRWAQSGPTYMVVGANNVLTINRNGTVTAADLMSGNQQWQLQLNPQDVGAELASSFATQDSFVVVGMSNLTVLDASSGAVRWQVQAQGSAAACPPRAGLGMVRGEATNCLPLPPSTTTQATTTATSTTTTTTTPTTPTAATSTTTVTTTTFTIQTSTSTTMATTTTPPTTTTISSADPTTTQSEFMSTSLTTTSTLNTTTEFVPSLLGDETHYDTRSIGAVIIIIMGALLFLFVVGKLIKGKTKVVLDDEGRVVVTAFDNPLFNPDFATPSQPLKAEKVPATDSEA